MERRPRNELYRLIREISDEISLKKARFTGHVIRMYMDRVTRRRVRKITGRTTVKIGIK